LPPILRIEYAVQDALGKKSFFKNHQCKIIIVLAEHNNSESFFIIEKMAQACQEY
jgi:hypothetical protein